MMLTMRPMLIINILIFSITIFAAPISKGQVPEPLQPWVDWVLHDQHKMGCPYMYSGTQRVCAWPSILELSLSESGGTFTQSWQVYADTNVRLPGDQKHWPQKIRAGETKLLVKNDNGLPYVKLSAGKHKVSGKFLWSKLPKSLSVTPESGLVNLSVNGAKVTSPQFKNNGQLWLTQISSETVSDDELDIQVFRKIVDSHPIQVETLIKLKVSGKQRNASLSSVLLDDFIPLSINSDLPARVNGDKKLQIQLRPGEWTITVIGRAPNDVTSFNLPKTVSPWPEQEVWVFSADNSMRQVYVQGANSIDPNQTRLPQQWKTLPTYLLKDDQTLTLDVRHRGGAISGHSQLALNREMWLDFDGGGYTFRDQLKGSLQQKSRLNAASNIKLGRVSVDGKPQFITQTSDGNTGIEIRQTSVNIEAEGRYSQSRSIIPISGWKQNINDVKTRLHLPAGWRVFSVNGTDNLPKSWLQNWSLLDLFLVLIIAFSSSNLLGWRWAGVAVITLALTWHEPGAPKFVWLSLLAAIALLSVLTKGKLNKLVTGYYIISLIVLASVLVPYVIKTVRLSIYPQLESTNYSQMYQRDTVNTQSERRSLEQLSKTQNYEPLESTPALLDESFSTKRVYKNKKKIDLKAIDPNSIIQTGPGLPSWRGARSVTLQWSGPIKAEDSSRIILISPLMNLILRMCGIALLLLFTLGIIRARKGGLPPTSQNKKSWYSTVTKQLGLGVVLVSMLSVFVAPDTAQASIIPDTNTLNTLKERLTETPECLPNCAQIEQMQVTVLGSTLRLRLRVHALTKTIIPLPGQQDVWLPDSIVLDGESLQDPELGIRRTSEKTLLVALDQGHHDLVLSGSLGDRTTMSLPLPLIPNHVRWDSPDSNWSVSGISDSGQAESQLQITRILAKDEQVKRDKEGNILPVFVKIERNLELGLDWYVETRVTRISPSTTPVSLNIPLLLGEQPLSDKLTINDNKVKVNLSAGQTEVTWSSRLKTTDLFILKAETNSSFLEVWNVSASPVWNVAASGIPISSHSDNDGKAVSSWRPWPQESLQLEVTRPKGVEGQTVTILSSTTRVKTGKRSNSVSLELLILSSQGVQHSITLPENVKVEQVRIDGETQRVQLDRNELSLTLKPNRQKVDIIWQEPKESLLSYQLPKVNLNLASVNAQSVLELPKDRWTLWVKGPDQGPVVLFWGVLLALLIFSVILSFMKVTPLKSWQWLLLFVGLSQTSPYLILIAVAWLVAIYMREHLKQPLSRFQFNGVQILLAGLIFLGILILTISVAKGLLGSPEMQIVGNGSRSYFLQWYQDRVLNVLPQPIIFSVPLWVYRALMLAWAIWLALSVLDWLRASWQALNIDGLWRHRPKKDTKPQMDEQK